MGQDGFKVTSPGDKRYIASVCREPAAKITADTAASHHRNAHGLMPCLSQVQPNAIT
jgi:hypothetical protein